MQTNHTNGPWIIYGDIEGQTAICDESDTIIAYLDKWSSERLRENVSNARLIAAAPDLLAALRHLLCNVEDGVDFGLHFEHPDNNFHESVTEARAAIARATGN